MHLREIFYGTLIFQQNSIIILYQPPCWRAYSLPSNIAAKTTFCLDLVKCLIVYAQMCCKRSHSNFSKFSLKFKCKICVQKEVHVHVIHNFKHLILVTMQGLKNQITIILLKIWPTNRYLKKKSYNFPFHKNNVI